MQIKDQLGRTITVVEYPKRIISLVPSQTELLFDLGLDEQVAGITKFCIHPQIWHQTKNKIGGTKNIDIEKVRSLNPDLIIGNKEENTKAQIEELAAFCPVYLSDVQHLQDALHMIHAIGHITGCPASALALVRKIEDKFAALNQATQHHKPKVVYLIWKDPYMTVGGDTFIHHMLTTAGFDNMFQEQVRYPQTDLANIKAMKPDFIFLSSEPYPFRQKHIAAIEKATACSCILINGEMFSWYGSRLFMAADYLKQLQTKYT